MQELVTTTWHRKKHNYAEVSKGVLKAFTQNLTNLGTKEIRMDYIFYH